MRKVRSDKKRKWKREKKQKERKGEERERKQIKWMKKETLQSELINRLRRYERSLGSLLL